MATRRTTKKPPDSIQRGMEFMERFGLPTALLIAAAYFGFTLIIEPLAKTYRDAIDKVAASSEELEAAVAENTKADSEHVREITESLRALENKLDAVLSRGER